MFTATSGQHISWDLFTSCPGSRHILRYILRHILRPLPIPSEKADRCLLFSEELPATQRAGPSLFSEVPSLELATSQAKQNRHILLMLEMHFTRARNTFYKYEKYNGHTSKALLKLNSFLLTSLSNTFYVFYTLGKYNLEKTNVSKSCLSLLNWGLFN